MKSKISATGNAAQKRQKRVPEAAQRAYEAVGGPLECASIFRQVLGSSKYEPLVTHSLQLLYDDVAAAFRSAQPGSKPARASRKDGDGDIYEAFSCCLGVLVGLGLMRVSGYDSSEFSVTRSNIKELTFTFESYGNGLFARSRRKT